MNSKNQLASDRFLSACPIRYECRNLFVYLIEMEYIEEKQTVETILQYPEQRDQNYFKSDQHLNDFLSNVKKFAFPYKKTIQSQSSNNQNKQNNSSLVQFYPFVFTDENRIRQYGYCRSAKAGNHIICLISYLPWYNVFIGLLNKIATIINEKETDSLYHFLEAVYEYELPEPGSFAEIFSHDGLDQIKFWCPDRRIVPSINENRNLLKFFAFFDLEKIIKIFTALLLERHILIVSKDIENMTACALSLEYLIYPLEWLHAFAPIMPEHIDPLVFNQPFPFIYGVHTAIYEKLSQSQKDDAFILLVDERQIVNGDKDKLPDNVVDDLHHKLKYFHENESLDTNHQTSVSRVNVDKYDRLLHTGTIQAFLDSVLMIIDDYREYLKLDPNTNQFRFDEDVYFSLKNVENSNKSSRYSNQSNEFYHEFRITQAFEEFCRDRSEYLKAELEFTKMNSDLEYTKDFYETLCDQYRSDNKTFQQIIKKGRKNIQKAFNKAKEKSFVKKFLNSTNSTNQKLAIQIIQDDKSSVTKEQEVTESKLKSVDLNYERSLSSVSSSSSNSSSSSSMNLNDEKIKETIRRFANATQSSLAKLDDLTELNRKSFNDAYSRLTIDLSNDPDIRKYFETQLEENVEPKEEQEPEKLIDFSDYQAPTDHQKVSVLNSVNISSSISTPVINNKNNLTFPTSVSSSANLYSTNNQIAVLNPSRVETKTTYESIIDEFDPIKNTAIEPVKQHFNLDTLVAKPFAANRPNYNVSLPLITPNTQNQMAASISFNNSSFYTNLNQTNGQYCNPTASETIARFNAMNRMNNSPSNVTANTLHKTQNDFNQFRSTFTNQK